ncbi:phage holin family protein [Aureimonas leprariae]|uniref:Phage holin family protein n=1 Tax=Plantimonas leprariae TaxID=2615207 RepID=A0A7V7PKI2_9HYPH|nr:phage holin family protein [Aureimonas leprariae]KAB0676178.1 phage holin family protein [Aureimonas leprariae]
MTMPADDRSFSDLVSDALAQVKALFRSEVQLAKLELSNKAVRASMAVAFLAAAAVFGIATAVMLLITIAALLTAAGVNAAASSVIATLVGAAAAGLLAWLGLQRLKADTLVPERTLRQVGKDPMAAKGQAR